MATKRVQNGSEDALTYKYAFVRSHCFGEDDEGQRLVNALKELNLSALDQSPIANELLARSVFTVFILVASADGPINKRESDELVKQLNHPENYASQLFQSALKIARENGARYTEEITAEGFDAQGELGAVGELLQEEHPEVAKNFTQCLMDFGTAIAKSSTGFFGIGRKVGKDEEETLFVILLALSGLAGNGDAAAE